MLLASFGLFSSIAASEISNFSPTTKLRQDQDIEEQSRMQVLKQEMSDRQKLPELNFKQYLDQKTEKEKKELEKKIKILSIDAPNTITKSDFFRKIIQAKTNLDQLNSPSLCQELDDLCQELVREVSGRIFDPRIAMCYTDIIFFIDINYTEDKSFTSACNHCGCVLNDHKLQPSQVKERHPYIKEAFPFFSNVLLYYFNIQNKIKSEIEKKEIKERADQILNFYKDLIHDPDERDVTCCIKMNSPVCQMEFDTSQDAFL